MQGGVLLLAAIHVRLGPSAAPVVLLGAVGLWWNCNTVSHIHLHTPIFRSRWQSRAFALYLTALLGVPQTIWRERHLAHHAGREASRRPLGFGITLEIVLVAAVWGLLLLRAPSFFFAVYLPAYLLGLLLCQAQGHFEHLGQLGGISHYGALYNVFWFNDGFHAEHHQHLGEHWTRLPARRLAVASVSRFSPLLRWLEPLHPLEWLEWWALGWPRLQRFMLETHERAFRRLLPALGDRPIARICIVGGGLFPRTALVLRTIYPTADLVLLDAEEGHLDRARDYLRENGHPLAQLEFRCGRFAPGACCDADLVVVPLGFFGDRKALYRQGSGPPIIVHDWLWHRCGRASTTVSLLLLKRLNLLR